MGRDMSNLDYKDDRNWVPVLYEQDGTRYCSPGCGHQCMRADYEAAHKCGQELAKTLGNGWSYHVWENLGWHVAANDESGFINVHPPLRLFGKGGVYHVMIDDEPGGGAGRWTALDEDPVVALNALRKIIRIEAELLQRISAAVDVGHARAERAKKRS